MKGEKGMKQSQDSQDRRKTGGIKGKARAGARHAMGWLVEEKKILDYKSEKKILYVLKL